MAKKKAKRKPLGRTNENDPHFIVVTHYGHDRDVQTKTLRTSSIAALRAYLSDHGGLHADEVGTRPMVYEARIVLGERVRVEAPHVEHARTRVRR